MRSVVSEMLQKKHGDYLDFYPDAKFSPWDDPPVGTLVLLGTRVCKVIGRNDAQFTGKPAHAPCPGCTCRAEDPLWGWWQIESLDIKDDRTGLPMVFLEYPPRLQPWTPSETHQSVER